MSKEAAMYGQATSVVEGSRFANTPEPNSARQSQIGSRVLELQENIQQLHENISALEHRLSPVLHPVPPSVVDKAATEPTDSTPLAQCVAEFAKNVLQANRRISEIVQRIEC